MAQNKFVGMQILDSELAGLINAATKIFPLTQTDIDTNSNPNNYEFGKVFNTTDQITYIYHWEPSLGQWKMAGAEDKHVDFVNDVVNKPSGYPPSAHNHTKSNISDFSHTHIKSEVTDFSHTHKKVDITDFPTIPTDTNQLAKTDVYTKTEVNTALGNKSDTTHNHDGRYATPTDLANKSDITHNHDSVYSKLGHNHDTVYAPISHNHDSSYAAKSYEGKTDQNTQDISQIQTNMANGDMHTNITTLNKLAYTGVQTTIDLKGIEDNTTALSGKANTTHNHVKSNITDFAHTHTKSEVTDFAHTHDDRYYTESEVDTAMSNKVDAITFNGHTGNTSVHITDVERTTWNGKSNFSGSYNDLSNKPTIPAMDGTVQTNLNADKLDGNDASAFAASSHNHVKANITDLPTMPAGAIVGTSDTQTLSNKTMATALNFAANTGVVFGTDGNAKGRFFTLPGVPNWVGIALNATYSGGWVLDDPTLNGWFFKLDSRSGMQSFAVYKIPTGAGAHTDEYPVFIIDAANGDNATFKGTISTPGIKLTLPTTNLEYDGISTTDTVDSATTTAVGKLLYASSTGYKLAQANAATTAPAVAIALGVGTGGSQSIGMRGYFKNTAWAFTKGQLLYLDPTTAGNITATRPSTAGQQVQIIGWAVATDTIYFNPQLVVVEI